MSHGHSHSTPDGGLKLLLVPALCVSVLVSSSAATAIYVDACATPGGDGSSSAPFTRLNDAVSGATSLDVVVIAFGVYRETLLIDKPLTLVGSGGDVVVGKLDQFAVGTMKVCIPLQVTTGEVCCHCVSSDLCSTNPDHFACPTAFEDCSKGDLPWINATLYYPTYNNHIACQSPAIVYTHGLRAPSWPTCGWNEQTRVNTDYLQANGLLQPLAASGFILASFDASCGLYGVGRGAFALNALAFLRDENDDPDSPLKGAVDLKHIGLAGHSLGGGGAIYAAIHVTDPVFHELGLTGVEVRAVAMIAPDTLDTAGLLSELAVPTLTIFGESDLGLTSEAYNEVAPPKHLAVVTGANHFGYTDSICVGNELVDLPSTVGGAVDREAHMRQQKAASNYLQAFFSHYLSGRSEPKEYLLQHKGNACATDDPPGCWPPRRYFEELQELNVEVSICSCLE